MYSNLTFLINSLILFLIFLFGGFILLNYKQNKKYSYVSFLVSFLILIFIFIYCKEKKTDKEYSDL
jgi:L-asparagine transporter-like permease